MELTTTHDEVREYYGRTLSGSDDLHTDAAHCEAVPPPRYVLEVMPLIADEIIARFYGCGSPIPPALEGATVLDLGCGSGRDVYVLSKLVGPTGHVIGVDMTPEQLEVAQKYQQEQAERFGYAESNVEFRLGYIEDLAACGIEDESIDVVVSNCVVNLSPFKDMVMAEVYRVLKPGGELYFSDVYASRRLPDEIRNDPIVHGECLGGATYAEDFRRKAEEIRAETKGDPRTAYEALLHSAAAARQSYPDFDLRRELSDPRFAAMAARGIDAKAAYEAVHHDELLRSAMAYGVQRTAERLAAAKMAARPSENGADSQAASVSKVDPRSLSRAEREELRRRVIDRGERITF